MFAVKMPLQPVMQTIAQALNREEQAKQAIASHHLLDF
ncbi:hypothetical protein NIES23_10280 [Trichormus variabilis NIES-23]|uniref:Uncharacterized protein n=1 Tax=Trichormus variabilis NIES-23 TaxID=1973479 RepID=A0A1Z4KH02_ANAVA|nr:hypothetical protein NIES23_10280 [Trichormus variabilis NIES-23]